MRPSKTALLACLSLFASISPVVSHGQNAKPFSKDGNRLAYLDHIDPYYPGRDFAKLITPQWISPEERKAGVEAVIILSIDDMRDPGKYENYLRPILNRLKQVKNANGKAPMSIFTNVIDVKHPQLQTWLNEGLSFEVHTIAHPCPCLGKFDLAKAKQTYHQCVDLLNQIPNYGGPVAFRMPCCDSMNSVSPRFFAEVMNGVSKKGNYLQIDSSVFNLFTANDPALPRELVLDKDGTERFRKYLPKGKGFVNYIEDYPYPYTIGNMIWQFPGVIPSDWEAQHLHGKNNPRTVEDLKAAIDCTVVKQGVFTFVFHPHGWIKAEQVVDLIDHAEKKHGGKVKFMSFADAAERLNKHLLAEQALRTPKKKREQEEHTVVVLDIDNDGHMDVASSQNGKTITRLWQQDTKSWTPQTLLIDLGNAAFGVFDNGHTCIAELATGRLDSAKQLKIHLHREGKWSAWRDMPKLADLKWPPPNRIRKDFILDRRNVRFHDIDSDGNSELIVTGGTAHRRAYLASVIFKFGNKEKRWVNYSVLPVHLPRDRFSFNGLRWIDLNSDGLEDAVFFNAEYYAIALQTRTEEWWISIFRGRADIEKIDRLPHPIRKGDGTNNGFFVKGRTLFWQNEDTGHLPGNVYKVTFDELLAAGRKQQTQPDANQPDAKKPDDKKKGASRYPPSPQPNPMSPQQSMKAMELRPGFKVELVAAEPLVMDPVAYDWGPDGKLWVVEMGDYPMGVDADKAPGSVGKPGGRVVYLTDTNSDGKYDTRTVFLEGVNFPTGIMAWDKGVLVTAAPDLFYAEDTNNDGKADFRETLFTGFAEGNQQHRVNGMRLGLDNWIHIGNGDSGGTVKLEGGIRRILHEKYLKNSLWPSPDVNINNRDLRIRPLDWAVLKGKNDPKWRQNNFERRNMPWLIDATSGQTQFGRERDDWGNWFGSNNPNPGWQYVYPDHYLRRNASFKAPDSRVMLTNDKNVYAISRVWSPSISNHNVKPGQPNPHTSANSLIIYRDDYYGPNFAPTWNTQNAFLSEPVHNLIRRHVLKRNGVLFQASRAPGEETREFLSSRDIWFRPTMLRVGPDGCLWIADVYRHVLEHPKWIQDDWEATLDLRAGADKGRIYRVVRVDVEAKPQVATGLGSMSDLQLVAALDSANGWRRDAAHMLLLQRNDVNSAPIASFLNWLEDRGPRKLPKDMTPEQEEVYAKEIRAWIVSTEFLKALRAMAVESDRPQARIHALSLLNAFFSLGPLTATQALNDPHPGVRRHAVQLCENYIGNREATDVLIPLFPRVKKALLARAEDADPSVCMQLGFTLGEWHHHEAVETLVSVIRRKGDNPHVLSAAMSSMANHPEAAFPALFRATEPHAKQALSAMIDTWIDRTKKNRQHHREIILRILGDGKTQYETWQYQAINSLIERTGGQPPQFTNAKIAYVLLKTEPLIDATNAKATPEHRAAAIRTAGHFAGALDVLEVSTKLMEDPSTPVAVQQAAVHALLADKALKNVINVLNRWANLSPAVRSTVLERMLAQKTGIVALFDAFEQGMITPAVLSVARKQALMNHKDDVIAIMASKWLGKPPEAMRGKVLKQYQSALSLKGDATRGRALFEKNCATCHHLAGIGKHVGPDLRGLKNGSPQALLAAILDPNQAVEDKYVSYIVETKSGDTFTGIITSESGNSLTLAGADGVSRQLLRKDILTLRSGKLSLMPEGLEQAMKPQDVADVIAFIGNAGPPPKVFANNQTQLIQPDKAGVLTLPASAAEVYGPRVIFEQKYRNLGHWYHEQDHAAWSIEVTKAGEYDVTIDWALGVPAANRFQLTVGEAKLEAGVPSTKSWDVYTRKVFGRIALKAGTHRLVFRSAGTLSGPLIDLRTVVLSPAR